MTRVKWLDMVIVTGALLLLAILVAGKPRAAEPRWMTYTFPAGQGALSLSSQPCTVPSAMEAWESIRAGVKARHGIDIGLPKQSRLLWYGQVYAGCYIVGPDDGSVYNIDSKGERLVPPLPLNQFVSHQRALPPGGTKL